MNTKKIIVSLGVLAVGAFIFAMVWPKAAPESEQVFCTQEAKLCPDGSYVGRTGPSCEFEKCPDLTLDTSWESFTDADQGVTFKYPKDLTTIYIHKVDWPPKINVNDGPFSCTEAGLENAPAGQTDKRVVDNREYCVTKESEGAAGSIYTQYAYAFPTNEKVLIFTFSLRSVQCGNYDDPQKTECESERTTFDVDRFVDQIAQTVEFN